DDTAPPGKPFSAVQTSRTYWDSARLGSIAQAVCHEHTASSHTRRIRRLRLRQVLELLKDDLRLPLDRHRRIAEDVEIDPDRLTARRRHAGEEVVGGQRRRGTARGRRRGPQGAEGHAPRLPAERVRQLAGRRGK